MGKVGATRETVVRFLTLPTWRSPRLLRKCHLHPLILERIWSSSGWISPVADYAIVAETARLIDTQEIARCRATRTGNPRDRRVVLAMSRELSSALAGLGFNPQDRANLGVGLSAPHRSRSRRTG